MPILNYTTTVNIERTVDEIRRVLASNRSVRTVSIDYDAGLPVAVTFIVNFREQDLHFSLPANAPRVLAALQKDRSVPARYRTREQATRIAWRNVLTWIKVQFAMIDSNQLDVQEVMLPFLLHSNGKTLYENFTSGHLLKEAN